MPKSVTFDREQVLQRMVALFWKKGYNGTSMQDLVEATGLNRSSFYNSFGDKFSIFEETLSYYQTEQYRFLESFLEGGKTPKQAIETFFKGISQDIINGNQRGCMITNCTTEMSESDPKIKDFLLKNKQKVVGLFASLIEKAQELGEIDSTKDAKNLALFLYSSLQGLRLTSMIDKEVKGIVSEVLSHL